jgi:hypothetical protein
MLPQVADAVDHIAQQEGVSASAVAGLFLAYTLCHYQEHISLDHAKRESQSPKWQYVVDRETILAILHGDTVLEELGNTK